MKEIEKTFFITFTINYFIYRKFLDLQKVYTFREKSCGQEIWSFRTAEELECIGDIKRIEKEKYPYMLTYSSRPRTGNTKSETSISVSESSDILVKLWMLKDISQYPQQLWMMSLMIFGL